MARKYVDISFIEADGQELHDVTRLEVDEEMSNAEVVETMTPARRALGTTRGQKRVTGTLETRVSMPREFDWHARMNGAEHFPLVYEESESGERFILLDFRVMGISRSRGSDGQATDRITWLALQHVQE